MNLDCPEIEWMDNPGLDEKKFEKAEFCSLGKVWEFFLRFVVVRRFFLKKNLLYYPKGNFFPWSFFWRWSQVLGVPKYSWSLFGQHIFDSKINSSPSNIFFLLERIRGWFDHCVLQKYFQKKFLPKILKYSKDNQI